MTEPLDIDALERFRAGANVPLTAPPHSVTPMEIGLAEMVVRLCDEVERLLGPRLTPDEEWEIARAKWQQDLYKRAGQMMARAASSRGLLDAIDNESGQSEAPTVSDGGKE